MIAGRFTMRADVERNGAAGQDAWGQPVAAAFAPLATVKCFIWSGSAREIVDGDKSANVEAVRGMFPLGTDLRADDELARVTDKRGQVLIAGRLKVDGPVQHKHNHLEAALVRVG